VTIVYLTSGTTWTVAGDWSSTNTIETIGGGSGGQSADNTGGGSGGGGGAYSNITNLSTLSPSSTVSIQVGQGGAANTSGGDTWFNGSTLSGSSVGAKAGAAGSDTAGGSGGSSSSGVGTTKNSGGIGGVAGAAANGGGGGGGAAGPNGSGSNGGAGQATSSYGNGGGGGGNGGGSSTVGDNGSSSGDGNGGKAEDGTAGGLGSNSTSTPGGNGSHGSGGGGGWNTLSPGVGSSAGGSGGNGIEWDAAHGSGGGGGGGGGCGDAQLGAAGGGGGNYGAGGAGGGWSTVSGNRGTGGAGGAGIIVITYTPATATTVMADAGAKVEFYKTGSTNQVAQFESGVSASSNSRTPIEVCSVSRRSGVNPVELTFSALGHWSLPVEATGAIAITVNTLLSLEHLARGQVDFRGRSEWSGRMPSNVQLYLEWLYGLTGDPNARGEILTVSSREPRSVLESPGGGASVVGLLALEWADPPGLLLVSLERLLRSPGRIRILAGPDSIHPLRGQ
jgi:hypothetical protein